MVIPWLIGYGVFAGRDGGAVCWTRERVIQTRVP